MTRKTKRVNGSLILAVFAGIFAGCGAGESTPDAGGSGRDAAIGPSDASSPGRDVGATDAVVTVPLPTCGKPDRLPSWRAGMAMGEWKQIASADITQVKPAVAPSGGYYGRIDAWNGFAADTVNSVVYLGGAGGHADYAGNEVYAIDLTTEAPQWVLQMQPAPASAYTVDQPYYRDGTPSPTHTYYSAWFIEQRRKFFRFATASTWGTGNGGTAHIDSWDPVTKAWDTMGTNPTLGQRTTPEMPTAKNFTTGDVYQIQGDNHLWRWEAATNTVADLGDAKGGSGSFYDIDRAAMVIEPEAQRLWIFSDIANPGETVRLFDLANKAWSSQKLNGPGAAGVTEKKGQSMAFSDGCAGRILVKSRQGGTVFVVDPSTFTATVLGTGGAPPPNAINGVHTLFQFLPRLGGYAYQPFHTAKLYFLATQ